MGMPGTIKKKMKRNEDSFSSVKDPLLPKLFTLLEDAKKQREVRPLDHILTTMEILDFLAEISSSSEPWRRSLFGHISVALLDPALRSPRPAIAQKAIDLISWLLKDPDTIRRLLTEGVGKEESESPEYPSAGLFGIVGEIFSRPITPENSSEVHFFALSLFFCSNRFFVCVCIIAAVAQVVGGPAPLGICLPLSRSLGHP